MNYRATVLQAAALPLVFKSTRAPYHCVASPWETAGTQQLEGKERSRDSAESNPPLIKMLRLTLLDLTFRRGNASTPHDLTAAAHATVQHGRCVFIVQQKSVHKLKRATHIAMHCKACDVPGYKKTKTKTHACAL